MIDAPALDIGIVEHVLQMAQVEKYPCISSNRNNIISENGAIVVHESFSFDMNFGYIYRVKLKDTSSDSATNHTVWSEDGSICKIATRADADFGLKFPPPHK